MSAIGMPDLESCEAHGDYTYLIGGESTCPVCKSDKIIIDLQSKLTAALKRIEELDAGLMPFAQFYNPRLPDNLPISQGSSMAKKQLVAADLRRAAALLKRVKP